MAFELYIIRHAQSANNALPESQRVEDPTITEIGKRQVASLAERFRDVHVTHALTSGFLRAIETMRPLAKAVGVPPAIWTDLHEVGGCYSGHVPGQIQGRPGMNREQLGQLFPEFQLPDDIDEAGWWKSKPFEDYLAAQVRAESQAARLRAEFTGSGAVVACVIHADFKDLLLRVFLDDHSWGECYDLRNTGVSHLAFTDDHVEVMALNDTSHLSGELVTS